ncbi:hypothetical protein Rxycam_02072 [Rubrobacter xylanophilus DSM 9941]|uniref:DUF1385 domain-containing protein n=1 Tax=Rubrobacter xylanophilus TaxID=49319 RepID=UPI001C640BB7|nr:DUF1385 domain-containing protein [Rubrobacter xylanophilus]QYJ16239.1 hypothetical protein Rxycam_02072 [Rubrobacter xylanophilus DSM 9941]
MAAGASKERLTFGGMARWDGLDLYGPNFMSVAYRRDGEIHVRVEPSRLRPPRSPAVRHLVRLPVVRSLFFWGRLVLQVAGSVWTLVFFAATLGALWLLVSLLEAGQDASGGLLGALLGLLAEFPILPVLALFFAAMRFTPVGRYHGAEHKAVAAYERYGEVTLEKARASSRIHPRCGTNILLYIILAALADPFIGWWGYSVLQFVLISEAWFVLGQSRPSIAVGNFLQRYFTTTEPRREELEVAVESLRQLLRSEEEHAGEEAARVPA